MYLKKQQQNKAKTKKKKKKKERKKDREKKEGVLSRIRTLHHRLQRMKKSILSKGLAFSIEL